MHRHMGIPQWKSKVDHLKSKVNTANKQVNELEKRLKESTGITMNETSNSDIMEENDASIHNLQREVFRGFFGNNSFRLQK